MALLCFTTLGSLTNAGSPLMTTDHWGPSIVVTSPSPWEATISLSLATNITKIAAASNIIIQTSIEIPTSASQSIVDDPMKVNCSSPLGPSAESPPNYSRSEILTLHPAAGKNAPRLRHGPSLDHRSRSIARILRIARIQYGDRNLLGLWHYQTSKHRNISRYTKYWKFLFVWLYLHWAVFVWVCGLVWSLCLCHRVIR